MASILLSGAIGILLFDTIGSLAARRWGFPYSRLSAGSLLIYFLVGFAAARADSLAAAAFSGGIVALVEATVGWAISWRVGPGRIIGEPATRYRIASTIVVVTVTGQLLGLLGGVIRQLFAEQAG